MGSGFWGSVYVLEGFKVVIQLLLLTSVGGAVTWAYAKMQKRRELRLQLLRDFTEIHGRFISLRWRYNPPHIQPVKGSYPLIEDEVRKERWEVFADACELVGRYQSLKPLLVDHFPGTKDLLDTLHDDYHEWRRSSLRNKPVLQNIDGSKQAQYEELKYRYHAVLVKMRKRI